MRQYVFTVPGLMQCKGESDSNGDHILAPLIYFKTRYYIYD